MIVCVTGTGTDVGKTVAVAALASVWSQRGHDVRVVKTIQTGEEAGQGDATTVARLTGVPVAEGWRYPEPLAPNLAARRAGMPTPTLTELTQWIREHDVDNGVLLVEGAGGLLVRLAVDVTLLSVCAELSAPLVVVSSLGLGSLNVAELTVREARRAGVRVAGLIGGSMPTEPDLATLLNVDELPAVTGVELWGALPAGIGECEAEEFAVIAQQALGAIPDPTQLPGRRRAR